MLDAYTFSDSTMVLYLFYISYPFIKQDYQIYPQFTRWSSLSENTKLTILQFRFRKIYCIKIYIGSNLWFRNLPPWKMKFMPMGLF